METAEAVSPGEVAAEVARQQQVVRAMEDAGQETMQPVIVDYFACTEVHRVNLPGGGDQWVEHKTLNEGDRKRYLNAQNRELRIQSVTKDAFIKTEMGTERHTLLAAAICGYHLYKGGRWIEFSGNKGDLDTFLDQMPPHIIDLIEKDVRAKNKWLGGDITIEDIDQQMEELKELRADKVKEAAGNVS